MLTIVDGIRLCEWKRNECEPKLWSFFRASIFQFALRQKLYRMCFSLINQFQRVNKWSSQVAAHYTDPWHSGNMVGVILAAPYETCSLIKCTVLRITVAERNATKQMTKIPPHSRQIIIFSFQSTNCWQAINYLIKNYMHLERVTFAVSRIVFVPSTQRT